MTHRTLLAPLLALALAACSGDDGGGGGGASPDTDADGLPDAEEATRGTSPLLADTDGDGYGDLEELVQYGFDPENNNFEFNPLVSDLPRLGIYFTTMPKVTLRYESSTGTSSEVSTAHERGIAQSQTSSESTSNSTAAEVSQSVGVELSTGVEVGTGGVSGSVSVTASYQATFSTSSERTVAFSSEQSRESSETWTEGQTRAETQGLTFTGGTLALAASVVNEGNLAFELRDLTLGVTSVSPGGDRTLTPVGNLVFDGADFPATTLGPGQSSTSLVFTKEDLDLGTARALLADSTGMQVVVSTYELTDAAGLGFNHRLTEVHARTAAVVIDYAGRGGHAVERYHVATNSDPDHLRITAKRAMEILRIPWATDAARRLSLVRDVANDPSIHRAWNVVLVTTDGVAQSIRTLRETGEWDFDALELQSGDVLHLVLMEDADGDGIGVRQEFAYGTRDDAGDLDADGLSDRDEALLYGLNPQRGDTDLDGKRDSQEVFRTVSMGPTGAVAVAVDGSAWWWGSLGVAGMTSDVPRRLDLAGLRVTSAVACEDRVFFVADDGSLWGMGDNGQGQVGLGEVLSASTPLPVATGTWTFVACGAFHTVGLTEDGSLYAWGASHVGQTGIHDVPPACFPQVPCLKVPTLVGAAGEWAAVSASGSTTLAVKKDGTLWSWGDNGSGQLGRVTALPHDNRAQVGAETTWSAVSAGGTHALALRRDGTLWSWGANDRGQLGRDGGALPARVGTGADWSLVATGERNSAAVRKDQSLWTWGDNGAGQAAYGVIGGFFDRPGIVTDLRFRQLSFGGSSVAALDRAFRVRTWGANDAGQLGIGHQNPRAVPTPIAQ